jgi:hypothetical protein
LGILKFKGNFAEISVDTHTHTQDTL